MVVTPDDCAVPTLARRQDCSGDPGFDTWLAVKIAVPISILILCACARFVRREEFRCRICSVYLAEYAVSCLPSLAAYTCRACYVSTHTSSPSVYVPPPEAVTITSSPRFVPTTIAVQAVNNPVQYARNPNGQQTAKYNSNTLCSPRQAAH